MSLNKSSDTYGLSSEHNDQITRGVGTVLNLSLKLKNLLNNNKSFYRALE